MDVVPIEERSITPSNRREDQPMTMAPNRKKRGYWIEIIFICVLLFLLLGSRSQNETVTGTKTSVMHESPRALNVQPLALALR